MCVISERRALRMDATTEKAYHRFWADGRSLGKPADDTELPLWAKAVVAVIAVALYCAMVLTVLWIWAFFWFKIQNAHVDWCAEAGGKMSVGALFYVSCYDLTPKKKGA